MKRDFLFGLAAGTLILTLTFLLIAKPAKEQGLPDRESAYDRVMRTNTLRCGYFSWNPVFVKHGNTGALSGIFHDYAEELGKALKLKIIWAEEIGLGDFPAALQSGRIDAMCSGVYVTSERARSMDFITPVYFVPLHAYARINDNRFDDFSITRFNRPAYRMAILEGGVTSLLHRQYFPKTKPYELPQMTSPAELFTALALRKADLVLHDRFTFEDYNAHNSGKLKRVTAKPIKIFPLAAAVGKNQDALREMLNTATMDLYLAGTIEQILRRYETYPDSLIRTALPYRE